MRMQVDSTVKVFALDGNGMPLSPQPSGFPKIVNTGGSFRADELAYDPDDQLILVANDDAADLFVTFIRVSSNPNNIKVVAKIDFSGGNGGVLGGASTNGIEQPVYDRSLHRFFLAVPATTGHTNGEVAVIDPSKIVSLPSFSQSAVVNVFDATATVNQTQIGCFPHGLALGPNQNLLLGCSADGPGGSKLISLILDATNGNQIKAFTNVGGSDEVWYNPGDNTYYLAANNWTRTGVKGGPSAPVLGIIDAGSDADGPEWIQNVPTITGSHSVAAVFAVRCDRDDRDRDNRGRNNCDRDDRDRVNFIRNRVYVPLTTSPLIGTPTEPGGIGVVGRIP